MKKKWTSLALICLSIAFSTGQAQNLFVTTNADAGEGTLRAAIDSANSHLGADTIRFNIPDITTTENGIIALISPLPEITDPGLTILGPATLYEFNGQESFLPDIQITGFNITNDSAIGLHITASDVNIYHLFLIGFNGGGILFEGTEIGTVSGCFLGQVQDLDEDKRGLVLADGISIRASTHILIGPTEGVPVGNVISGFAGNGISLADSSAFNGIYGNDIGFNPIETQYFNNGNGANGISISTDCTFNEIIGNRIGNNQGHGIVVISSSQNFLIENQIGTTQEFQDSIGNFGSGIYLLEGAQLNNVIGNQIGYNSNYGIVNEGNSTTRNIFSRNLISKNTIGGIRNLGGGNDTVAPPVLQSIINFEIRGMAGSYQLIEFFLDENNQGQIYLDSTTTDQQGNFSLQLTESIADLNVTATARDEYGNTSEFSEPQKENNIGGQHTIIVSSTDDSGSGSFREAIEISNESIGPDTIQFNISKSDSGFDVSKGVWFIIPDTPFAPILDDGLFIDGPSQSRFLGEDSNPLGPEIVISGKNDSSFAAGLTILGINTEVYGLTINNFKGAGISLYKSGFARFSGCYIGTNYNGMESAGNNDGIVLGYLSGNSIVGPTDYYPHGNLISGNKRMGLFVVDSSWHNIIIGNQIGTNRNNTATLGNQGEGLNLARDCHYNEIFDNTISGNAHGIILYESRHNTIANNNIGIYDSGSGFGNVGAGIYLWMNSGQNFIFENQIEFNGDYGIYNEGPGSIQNLFSRNNFRNNNNGDIINYNGGNLELEPPTRLAITKRTLNGRAVSGQIVELFLVDDTAGVHYLDSVLTISSGEFIYIFDTIPDEISIVATARDTAGNTSQFSELFNLTTAFSHPSLPLAFLYQNRPNPTSDETVISYSVKTPTKIDISLLDHRGILVKKIRRIHRSPGHYSLRLDVNTLNQGVYYYRLSLSNGNQVTRKMIVVR